MKAFRRYRILNIIFQAYQEKDFRQRLEAEANRFTDLSKQIQTLKDEAAESKSSAEKVTVFYQTYLPRWKRNLHIKIF